MFEIAQLDHRVSKSEYEVQVPELRMSLLLVQQQLKDYDFPVLILISGVDGGGKGKVINLLNEWMDPRFIRTAAYDVPSAEELERPKFWRYWRDLPGKGMIGIFVGSWYSEIISGRVSKQLDAHEFAVEVGQIKQLEQALIDDGGLIIKCWLHLSKSEQQKRLKRLQQDPDTSWRVTDQDRKHLKQYNQFVQVAEQVLKTTSTGKSPWLVIDSSDIRYSSLSVGQHVLGRIKQHIELQQRNNQENDVAAVTPIHQQNLLDQLDLDKKLVAAEYEEKLKKLQARLGKLARAASQKKLSSILVFEGWDAAGKGGAIRRLAHAMDARNYVLIPIAAPTDEERRHHYLWRFWRHLPKAGKVTIYDRSWYGRVLVERVEGLANSEEWMRAYSEIVDFEDQLTRHGILLLKFWLHIDKEEQLKRFKEREQIPHKQHKITAEDYRNRERWEEYKQAVNEMVTRTSTRSSPWLMVAANNKKYARINVLETYCDYLEKML